MANRKKPARARATLKKALATPAESTDLDPREVTEQRIIGARAPMVKAFIVGEDNSVRPVSNAADTEDAKLFEQHHALLPPYDSKRLCEVHEMSSALRQNVDAMETNIEAFGHHLEPELDLNGDDVRERVADAIYLEKLILQDRGEAISEAELEPTDAEVEKRITQLGREMAVEHFKLNRFLDSCTVEESLVSLRRKSRKDLEITGNGYWEVLRGLDAKPVQFNFLQSYTMRLTALDTEVVQVDLPVRITPLQLGVEKVQRRFRRFMQLTDRRIIYFKEYGDPRVLSSKSGKFFATKELFQAAEPGVPAATEVIHFKIHSPSSPYGVPRWIGNLITVLGMYHAEEVNFLYFENKAVPPLVILVSGGRLTESAAKRVEDFIETRIKGKKNFHAVLVLEAESQASADGLENTGKVRVEIKPLTEAQQQDALFQKYDERGMDKVGMSFRLPRLLRGDMRDFNRASAEAAIEVAESQVFGPERYEFDFRFNRLVCSALGVRYWKFRSNAVQIQNPKVIAEMIAMLTKVGTLTPQDGREIASETVFNRPLSRIEADWVNQPIMLTQTGVPADATLDGTIPAPAAPAGADAKAPQQQRPSRTQTTKSTARGGWVSPRAGQLVKKLAQREMTDLAHKVIALRDEMVRLEKAQEAQLQRAFKAEDPQETGSAPEVFHVGKNGKLVPEAKAA